MLAPFVFPKALVVALVVLPICIHKIEEICLAGCRNNGRYVGILSVLIAILVECTITVVWPILH